MTRDALGAVCAEDPDGVWAEDDAAVVREHRQLAVAPLETRKEERGRDASGALARARACARGAARRERAALIFAAVKLMDENAR